MNTKGREPSPPKRVAKAGGCKRKEQQVALTVEGARDVAGQIIQAVNELGGVDYWKELAKTHPSAFATVATKIILTMMPKDNKAPVQALQINYNEPGSKAYIPEVKKMSVEQVKEMQHESILRDVMGHQVDQSLHQSED
jgi:hypothetical protein